MDANVLLYAEGVEHPLRTPCRRLVRSRRRSRASAALLARLFAESIAVVDTTLDDFDHGLDLFDAEAVVSVDRAFAQVHGLRHVDPATPALDQLIAGR